MKENGFAIGLLIVTLIIGGGLVALGMTQGKRYASLEADYSDIKGDVEKKARVRPFPNEENLEERKTQVTAFRGKVEGLQNAIQSYRPESLEAISPSEFQNRLVTKTIEMKANLEEKGISYPNQFAFGMESYLDALANPEATAKLNYQLNATEWLFEQLVAGPAYEIRNIVREALPSESGKDWTAVYDERREPIPLAQSMPLEVVFLADEPVVSEFLNTLVSSKDYFFAVDMVRFGNENISAPVREQSGLEEFEEEEEAAGGDSFEGFGVFDDFEEDDVEADGDAEAETDADGEPVEMVKDEEAEVVETGLILGQVAGKEGLYVGLQLRLLLFDEAIELPEIK